MERQALSIGPSERESPGFRYDALTASVANFLRSQADRIQRTASKSIIHIGKDLIAAKHYLSHGRFIAWVENEVGIPARTAQVYMKVAQWSSNKSESVARLPPSALYILSAPSTPDEFTREIVRRFEAGERLGAAAIRNAWKQQCCETPPIEASTIEGATADEPAHASDARETASTINGYIVEIVSFLAQHLSEDAFQFVKDAMTRPEFIDEPNLGCSLEKAFSMQQSSAPVSETGYSSDATHVPGPTC